MAALIRDMLQAAVTYGSFDCLMKCIPLVQPGQSLWDNSVWYTNKWFFSQKKKSAFSDENWEAIFSMDLRDMQLKNVKFACIQNLTEGWAGHVTTFLAWLDNPNILLTAPVDNSLTLNKLNVPLCNPTLQLTQVRRRMETSRFLLPNGCWLIITAKQFATSHQIELEWAEHGSEGPLVYQKPDFRGSIRQKPPMAWGFLFRSFNLAWLVERTSMGTATAPNLSPAEISHICSTAWGHQSLRRV